jgi:hypothetical protein
MNPIAWLRERLEGFPAPQQGDLLKAITDFVLLWSFFEGMVLATWGSADRMTQRVREWHGVLHFPIGEFANHLEYFRDRYCPNGEWDPRYSMLIRLSEANEALVKRVLERQTEDPVEHVSAILLLVLRIRNNLFHGPKMLWGFHDQAENFHHANLALMSACELERRARGAGLAAMELPGQ